MAGTFGLELYRPDNNYLIPNNGTSLQVLNNGSYNTCTIATIDENLDLGSTAIVVTSNQNYKRYGNILQSYNRSDRVIKFSILLFESNAGSDANLRAAVRYMQAIISECNQFNTNLANANTSRNIGAPLMLKYQPISSVSPVFFYVKYGVLNIGTYNDANNLNGNIAQINFELTTSYAAYGYGSWLENMVPNGTFAYGLKSWSNWQQITANSNYPLGFSVELFSNKFNLLNFGSLITGAAQTTYIDKVFISSTYGGSNSNPLIEKGYDALWGFTDSTTGNVFSGIVYRPFGTTTSVVDTMVRSDSGSMGLTTGSPSGTTWQWLPQVGTWGIVSNKAYSVTAANNDITLISSDSDFSGISTESPCTIQVDMLGTLNSGTIYNVPLLAFRYFDANNFMYARVFNGNVQLTVVIAGVETSLGSATQALADNTNFTLKVILAGSNIQVFVNSTQKINYTDSSNTYSRFKNFYKVGFINQRGGAPATIAKWANFSIDTTNAYLTSKISAANAADVYTVSLDYKDESTNNINPITDYFKRGVSGNINLSNSNVTDSGQTWTIQSGIPVLTTSNYYAIDAVNEKVGVLQNTSNGQLGIATIDLTTASQQLWATVPTLLYSGGTYDGFVGSESGIIFRYTDNNNYWFATIVGTTTSTVTFAVKKKVGGTVTTVNSGVFGNGTSRTAVPSITIITNGSTISAWFNEGNFLGESPTFTITDSFNSTATKVGVYFDVNSTRFIDTFKAAHIESAMAGIQGRNSGSSDWTTSGEIFFLNNTPNWTSFKWVRPTKLKPFDSQIRFFAKFNKANASSGIRHFRKISINHYPVNPAFYNYTSSVEFLSQPTDTSDLAILTGIQGTMESNCRLAIDNTARAGQPLGTAGSDVVIYQQATIGMRKMKGLPIPFHQGYTNDTVFSMPSGANYASQGSNNFITIIPNQYIDGQMRRYKVIANISTNGAVGMTFGSTPSGDSNIKMFQLVPNQILPEIPNTSSTYQYVDIGTFNLLPTNIKAPMPNTSLFSYNGFVVSYNFIRTTNSGTGAINIGIRDLWFIPADDINYIDTRAQYPSPSTNSFIYQNTWGSVPSASNALVFDSLMSERVDNYLIDSRQETVIGMYPLNASSTNNIFRLSPTTTSSPEPIGIGTVIRRQGTSGNPATTVQLEQLDYAIIYCPAYEF